MAGSIRNDSVDSGLLSDQVVNNAEETELKPIFSSSDKNRPNENHSNLPHRSHSYHTNSHSVPTNHNAETRRKSFQHHGGEVSSKTDSDSDIGIVPDITKMLLGNRQQKRHKNTEPTYSIHINTLYVYQNPTMPVENPLYQQLPVDKHDEIPPSPCSKPGYQYVWPKQEDIRLAQQHHDSTDGQQHPRPTSLNVSSSEESYKAVYAKPSKEKPGNQDAKSSKDVEQAVYLSLSSPNSPEVEEMEILIKNKGGKSRRYKLQPIKEQQDRQDPYVLKSISGERGYVIEGCSINDEKDEAYSEENSIVFPDSSNTSIASGHTSVTAIDTTLGDCKITVNQAFKSANEDKKRTKKIPTSASMNELYLMDTPPKTHGLQDSSLPITQNLRQAVSMNDPTYFDFEQSNDADSNSASKYPGNLTRSVPNMALSSQTELCYQCQNHRRGGLFSPKQRSSKKCTIEGYFDVTDENEASLMKDILNKKGKLGHWFIIPTSNQPGYCSNLYAKTKWEVTNFPIAINKKKKVFLDLSSKKSFPCLCKLIDHYQSNHLPSISINLGQPLPKQLIPAMNFGADGENTMKEQYAGIRL